MVWQSDFSEAAVLPPARGDIPEQGSAAESVQTEASAEKTQNSNSGERKKLVLWTWAPGQFNKVQEAFLASHPDADWQFEEVVVSVEDYLTKLQQGYASGGDMPDILMAEMGVERQCVRFGYMGESGSGAL